MCNYTLLEVTCVGYRPLLEGIYSGNYNPRVQRPLGLVKAVEKDIINTQRVGIFNVSISPTNLL